MVVSDYQQMDRILKEERNYIISLIKKIKASGCNVLLIQKSILRDAVSPPTFPAARAEVCAKVLPAKYPSVAFDFFFSVAA